MRTEKNPALVREALVSGASKSTYDFAASCSHQDGTDGVHISMHDMTGAGVTNVFLEIHQAERMLRGLQEALANHFRKVNS